MAGIAPDMTVRLTDGTEYRVANSYADMLSWERYAMAHGLDKTKALFAMSGFYAWRGARKQGVCGQDTDLDTFAERIDTFEMDDPEEPVPPPPAPGAG